MAEVRSKTSIPIVADFIAGGGTDIICDTTAGIAYFLNGLNVVVPIGANYAYTDEQVRDAVGAAFAAGTQTGLTITYDDPNDKFSFTVATTTADVRNFIINGGMDVWQRGTSFVNPTNVSNATFYGPDRWGCNRTGNVTGVSISRQGSPTGGRYSLLQQRTAGDTSTAVIASYYTIETADSMFLAGKTVTFSVAAIKAGTYSGGNWTLSLIYGTGTDERVYAFTGAVTVATSANALTTSWARYSVTGAIPSTATEVGVTLTWTPSGTAGAADAVFFTQAQLEVGSSGTAYVARPIELEFYLCKRYFEKSFPPETLPATTGGLPGAHFTTTAVAGAAVNNFASHPRFLASKRGTPTIILYNPSAANNQLRNTSAGTDGTAAAAGNISQTGMTVTCTGAAGWAANQVVAYQWAADAEI